MPSSALGEYLHSELYDVWAKNRKPVEAKWLKNERAFKSISEGDWKTEEGDGWRSNTFISTTKVKVLSAYAICIDILLKGGMIPFTLELSPWDRVVLEEMPPDQQAQIKDAIDDMTKLIKQQVIDCQGDRELMKCIMSAARYGETYWKSYVHDVTRKGFQSVNMAQQGIQPVNRWERFEKTVSSPAFGYCSNWDMFRDMETDNMQKGRGVCQRTYTSPFELRQLIGKKDQYYIDSAIKQVLRDNSKGIDTRSTESLPPGLRDIQERYNNIEKLEFWCRVPRQTIENFKKSQKGNLKPPNDFNDDNKEGDEVEVGVCMANDEVIRLVEIPAGTRPHGRVVWEINLDDNHGIGVADNVEQTQLSLNGMVRAFEDNKKLSANVMVAVKEDNIENWTGEFKPGENINITDETERVQDAIQQILIQDVGETLLSGIALMERYSDDAAMLPKILQGSVLQKQKPDTLGELNLLQENASKYMGSVIKNFDEGMIEPIVERFYEYNMMDPNLQQGKGNYIAKASGYSAWQDRAAKLTKLMQALQLAVTNPAITQEIRIRSLVEAIFQALEIDVDEAFKTPEEKAQDQQAAAQAQQQELDKMTALMLAKAKSEMEKEVGKIRAQHQAKLEQMQIEHKNKLKEMDAESENRIVEDKLTEKGSVH